MRRAKNIFMPKNINCITTIIHLGIEKIKTETKKMTTKKNFSVTGAGRKR